jgi:predicted DsbA family dithiol-disulfide isomerase
MVDRVYKTDIPAIRKSLEKLRAEFARFDPTTDWTKLRVDPLLRHVKLLEQQLRLQSKFRLKRGVRMFHSDLVYFRENIKGLNKVLQDERSSLERKAKRLAKWAG